MCLCLCFLGGELCLRRGGGESEGSRLDLGEGEQYLDRELGGVECDRERRLRELEGEPRLERDGDDRRL